MQEPIWWHRPINPDNLVKQEADGLYSYNLPLIGQAFKAGYNILLNKNSIPIAIMIKMNPKWTAEQISYLYNSTFEAVYQSLIALGVDPAKLDNPRNDLLYNGKKFMGIESMDRDGWFSANCFITLQYTPEKMVFDRLTGKHALARGITGIIEETSLFTKEELIKMLETKFKEILAKL
jgi:lipoate-protein ligase A